MPNRYITKLQPVDVQGKPYTLSHFVFDMVEHDVRFSQDAEGVRSRARLEGAVVKHQGDSFVEVAEKDWQRLHQATEQPSKKQYPVAPATLCLGFIEAIRLASATPPAVVAPSPEVPTERPKRSRKKKQGAPAT